MAQRPQPSLRLADGGSFITRWAQSVMRPNATANRLREADAPPPPPAAPAPPPPPPPNPNATPDNPAGIRFQDGGVVPGTGRGDKIPAKYEPGEFVVSNDMIDDNPGLREQLSGLRAETLAARGKTVEEADAKALRYHGGLRGGAHGQETRNEELPAAHAGGRDLQRLDGQGGDVLHSRGGAPQGVRNAQVSLRANAGFGGSADPDFWRGNPNPLQGNQANQTLLDAARQRIDPVQTAARNAAAAPATPTMDPPGNPNVRPGGSAEANAFRQTQAAAPAVEPAAPKGPSATSKWLGTADDWKNSTKGPADSPHKTLRMTAPSAPTGLAKAGGVVQGVMGAKDVYDGIQEGDAWKTGVGAADAVAGAALFTPAAPVAGAYLGLRGAYDTAKAAGGAIYNNLSEGARDVVGGTVNQIGLNTGLWGTDDSTKMQMDAAAPTTLRKTAPGAPTQTRPEDTFAGPPESARSPVGGTVGPDGATNPNGYVTRNGNEYSGTNVRGDITINGFAPGAGLARGQISAQNMAAADALAGTQNAESMARVQAQMAAEQRAERSPPNSLRQRAFDTLGTRELGSRKTARAMLDAANSMEQNANQRYSADSSLRGQMYSADTQQGAKQMEMQQRLRQQQLKGAIFREAGGKPEVAAQIAASYGLDPKDFTDMASASQTRDHNATTNARKRLEGMAVRSDDKGGTVVDPGRLARLESTLGKMSPGWQHMSEPEQAKHLATAEAGVNLIEGLNDRRNNGFWQSIGVDGSSASLDKLPIEAMKGGRLRTVKALEGAFTGGGVEREDYVIETGGGHKLYLPRDKVNQGELELLKSRGVDISSLQK